MGATKMIRSRQPTTPGEILAGELLAPLGITQKQLADHLGCDVKVINRIVNGRTRVTPELALKLGAALRTSADLWLPRRCHASFRRRCHASFRVIHSRE
ncbi:MAG: HigA family addiction module antidote protein [Thermoanaerobaculia bacterium]|nr:HigA family addiction module antidote protein [Thermoanaerobaculia bacterium]